MKFWLPLLLVLAACTANAQTTTITEADLLNRIKGGWAGQMIGVTVGTPAEFQAQGEMYTKPIVWDAEDLDVVFQQDDLYVEMTFMRVLEEKGLDATMIDFGKAFGESGYQLWHANFMGRHNIQQGILPPDSGHPKYNAHADDIDFQIETDFIGLMTPGMPNTAVEYADRVGHVMNYGDGVYGGMFISAMFSAAFFSDDVNEVLEAGLAVVPKESEFYLALRDTVNFYKKHPDDLAAAWQLYEDKWANTDACPYGAARPFDIDAKTNSAYVAFGLLYGQGDFVKTIDASIKCGQDNDCNPASAAGVLGTMMGYDALPADWRERLEAAAEKKFSYTEYGFANVCEQSLIQAKALIARNGGSIDGETITIALQDPKPAPLEQWQQDEPVKRMEAADPGLVYTGAWEDIDTGKRSNEPGATISVTFEGTGALINGIYGKRYGILEASVDGEIQRQANTFFNEAKYRQNEMHHESLFHIMGLPRGEHTVTLKVTGEKAPEAEDAYIAVQGAVVFDGPEKRR